MTKAATQNLDRFSNTVLCRLGREDAVKVSEIVMRKNHRTVHPSIFSEASRRISTTTTQRCMPLNPEKHCFDPNLDRACHRVGHVEFADV